MIAPKRHNYTLPTPEQALTFAASLTGPGVSSVTIKGCTVWWTEEGTD